MQLQIYLEKEQLTKKVTFNKTTVQDLLQQLNINPETVLVVQNNEILTEQEPIQPKLKIEILSVISGG